MESRDRHGREMGGPERSDDNRYRPYRPRRGGGFGQFHAAQDVGWAPGARGWRARGGFRRANWRQTAGYSARGWGTWQRFGGSDSTPRWEGPRGRHHVGDVSVFTRGARGRRCFKVSKYGALRTPGFLWNSEQEGDDPLKFKTMPEIWTCIGGVDVYKGANKRGILYICSVCRFQNSSFSSITEHMASKMHEESLTYIKHKDGPMVSKFVHAYIWWRINRRKHKSQQKTVAEGSLSSAHVLDAAPASSATAYSATSDLDETMEKLSTVWCRACAEHVPDIPSAVARHAGSGGHIEKLQSYRKCREVYVMQVATNIMNMEHHSALFEEFKLNPGEEVVERFYEKLREQTLKDPVIASSPQSAEDASRHSDSEVEELFDEMDGDDNGIPETAKPEDTWRSLEDDFPEDDSQREGAQSDPFKSSRVDATGEPSVDLTGKGKGRRAGETSADIVEGEGKEAEVFAVAFEDAEFSCDIQSDDDQEETASNRQSDDEEYAVLYNYSAEDDDDFEAWEVVQCEDEAD